MAGQNDEETEVLSLKVDKRPISQAQLIGFALMILTNVFVGGGLWYKYSTLATEAASKADFALLSAKVDNQENVRAAQTASIDRNVDDIQAQLKPLATIELRMDLSDKRNDAQDARIDKILELVSGKLDALNESLAGVKADVRVVAQDVKNIAAKTQPMMYRKPMMPN